MARNSELICSSITFDCAQTWSVELKSQDFKPNSAAKMNFYLSAIDDLLRHPDDQPSIGIILCKSKNEFVAEYALRDLGKPVGISEYHLPKLFPKASGKVSVNDLNNSKHN